MIRSADCRRSVNVDEPLLYLSFLQSPGSVYRTKEILRNCIRQVTEQKHGTIRRYKRCITVPRTSGLLQKRLIVSSDTPMISLRNQAVIESWEQLTRDMVRLTKDRVRSFFGRCCLLLSDFRSRTANEFYIPTRPKGFTRRDYLRSGRVSSLHRRVNHEREQGVE
ncbi:uncharacterized protein LOC114929156 isoform X1 [Nylanderia fulva]|uniref:uncharacterized protein LOC114929156 isoform X1 n=1 Tax=Nylanderia fulva TaxID=613905 RepID=UPI0010FB7598|nr:uncharacterized protein LOC114929156 isoform X1 [Nylanderia fulva]